MARKQIKTVRLERQPHREAMRRLRLAYQHWADATKRAASPTERTTRPKSPTQEVPS